MSKKLKVKKVEAYLPKKKINMELVHCGSHRKRFADKIFCFRGECQNTNCDRNREYSCYGEWYLCKKCERAITVSKYHYPHCDCEEKKKSSKGGDEK